MNFYQQYFHKAIWCLSDVTFARIGKLVIFKTRDGQTSLYLFLKITANRVQCFIFL